MEILNLVDVPQCLDLISEWHHNEWSYLNPGRTLAARIEKMQEHLEGKDIPTTYVAITDRVVGSAALVESDMPERPELTPWLASVFVDSNARRQGVGRALVHRVMLYAQSVGVKTMYLYTPDREHFYAHMGWQTLEKLEYHGANVTLMKIDF
ncbi:MAG: GNAT family N-acetyltransferase [Candidatus Riflebacteria bacterium]|nr:GNAT family N-acetyltransferase [Candidatus Riflebacteria bacterium]